MTRTPREIENAIVKTLNLTDPALSIGIGTPERKIISAVSEAISESYIDNYVATQAWDIDTLTGDDLEKFCGLFGFGRLLGRYAVGKVTFSTNNAAQENLTIPIGTQVYSAATVATPQLFFATTTPAVIAKGSTSVEVPAQCTVTGVIGNIGIGAITGYNTQYGITGIINNSPFAGGQDVESDENLRARFRQTVLRNIAGTADFYRDMCLMHKDVSKVNIIGPISRWTEQLQMTDTGCSSTISTDISKYLWPSSEIVSKNVGMDGEKFYVPDLHYQKTTAQNSPILAIKSLKKPDGNSWIPTGDVLDVEHEYTSTASRNDPANGIMNKVDIYINGQDPIVTTDITVMGTQKLNSADGIYAAKNWKRINATGGIAASGSTVTLLGQSPVMVMPEILTIGEKVFKKGVDFELIEYQDEYTGSAKGRFGLEWTGTNMPDAKSEMSITYTYNRIPVVLDALLDDKRQITTDPLVRMATPVYLKVNLIVMFTAGYDSGQVKTDINSALAGWMAKLPFGTWLQMADIEQVVHGVAGVDNVRVANKTDTKYQGSVYKMVGETAGWSSYADFKLEDNELPIFYDTSIDRKSFNTFDPK